MKMPSIPKIPKISMDDIRERLPFQPRREFVLQDSEHPDNAAAMEYRPSTGYPTPETAPVSPARPYGNIDHEMPFQQEMVYPGGVRRVPYAAGGQARMEYTGSWPPPNPQAAQPDAPRPPVQTPRQEPVPPAFAQAEYYVPRQNYRPSPEYAQPRYYHAPPQQTGPVAQTAYPGAPQAAHSQTPPRQTGSQKPTEKTNQPGFPVKLAAMVGALLPRKRAPQSGQPSRPPEAPRQTQHYAAMNNGAAQGYYAPRQPVSPPPQRPALRPLELKYYIWSGSIVAGLLLTVVSFIYACAA